MPRTMGTPASTRAASLLANTAFSRIPGLASSRLFSCFRREVLALVVAAARLLLTVAWVCLSTLLTWMPRRRRSRRAEVASAASMVRLTDLPRLLV